MSTTVTNPPAELPLSLGELKDHLRLIGDDGSQNDMLERLIATAAAVAEEQTGRALVTRDLELHLDAFPTGRFIELPAPPAVAVSEIRYHDPLGDWQVLTAADYHADVDHVPGRIQMQPGLAWPCTRRVSGAVKVSYQAGYGDAAHVPASLRHAMLMLAAHWYDNPAAVVTGTIATQIPLAVETIFQQYAMPRL